MKITITTDGGFTGRGIGSASVDEDATPQIARAVAEARPDAWRDDYPSRGADQVRYTLTFRGRVVSFVDGAELPRDLRALFECVWNARS